MRRILLAVALSIVALAILASAKTAEAGDGWILIHATADFTINEWRLPEAFPSNVRQAQMDKLKAVAAKIRSDYPGWEVKFTGYADYHGETSGFTGNGQLAHLRATEVKRVEIEAGLPEAQTLCDADGNFRNKNRVVRIYVRKPPTSGAAGAPGERGRGIADVEIEPVDPDEEVRVENRDSPQGIISRIFMPTARPGAAGASGGDGVSALLYAGYQTYMDSNGNYSYFIAEGGFDLLWGRHEFFFHGGLGPNQHAGLDTEVGGGYRIFGESWAGFEAGITSRWFQVEHGNHTDRWGFPILNAGLVGRHFDDRLIWGVGPNCGLQFESKSPAQEDVTRVTIPYGVMFRVGYRF
ncbi:MAG: hypothetical protein WC480_02410 [Patescibacteria group bacterium]